MISLRHPGQEPHAARARGDRYLKIRSTACPRCMKAAPGREGRAARRIFFAPSLGCAGCDPPMQIGRETMRRLIRASVAARFALALAVALAGAPMVEAQFANVQERQLGERVLSLGSWGADVFYLQQHLA